ncbi:PepSY-associated TM helix domain-containing protein [Paenibacillus caseinilyticus]|nr:PepSY domain-containing protein [Paenibacillus caseinilyticus]MCZ8520384.1 PepSY domain-containing protein [Paenibacillus caseinilyticus]
MWRWHFYAGLIFAPFLILLAVTGAVYLFKPQVESVLYRSYHTVAAGPQALAPSAQLAKVQEQFPDDSVTKFKPGATVTRSSEFTVTGEEGSRVVFVNPYNGEILGTLDESTTFMTLVKQLHGGSIAGAAGNLLVELTACWAVILIVTGVYLWWPRGQRSAAGIVYPRLRQGKRTFWRDVHAVPAFWLSLFMVILIFTGLPWSAVWGEGLNRFANATNTNSPPSLYGAKPQSTVPTKDVAADVPWAAELMPVPGSSLPGVAGGLSIDRVVRIAEEQKLDGGYAVTFPKGERGVYTVAATPDKPEGQATLHIDRYSGQVLADLRFKDYGITARMISIGIALHEGRYFGLANQIAGLVACLGIVAIAFSGVVMWWRRRPAGKLAAPARPQQYKLAKGLTAIMIGFGLFFPLVGLSLLLVLLLDLAVIRRSPAMKEAA